MSRLFLHVPPIGIGPDDNFHYNGLRPARHCGICGESFQPELARCPEYNTDPEVRLAVELLLREWAIKHNKKHTTKEQQHYAERGNLMTPEAAIKLIPLGIYPIQDLLEDDEVIQAGLEAPRAPSDDVRYR
jgi:hypothetical protein